MADAVQFRSEVLKTMITEDRKEVRGIRSAMYKIIYILALSSFALTAFTIEKSGHMVLSRLRPLSATIDGLIIVAVVASYWRLKKDLRHARQGLRFRQDAFNDLLKDPPVFRNPFGDAGEVEPDIKDAELIWIPIAAALAILVKAVAMQGVLAW